MSCGSNVMEDMYPNENMVSLDNMDPTIKSTLDSWLKYGSMMLIYRVGTFYYNGEDGELFDKNTLITALYVLLGFALYFAIIQPLIPVNFSHPLLNDVANDTLLFGSALAGYHLLDVFVREKYITHDHSYSAMDRVKDSVAILVAFAIYRVIVNPFIPTSGLNNVTRPVVNDIMQFSTVLLAIRLFSGKSLLGENFIVSSVSLLLGVTTYDLVVKKLIN